MSDVHDDSPSDISEWRMSCSNTITSNLQRSIEFAVASMWQFARKNTKKIIHSEKPFDVSCVLYCAFGSLVRALRSGQFVWQAFHVGGELHL